jgi:hypothetical protein
MPFGVLIQLMQVDATASGLSFGVDIREWW